MFKRMEYQKATAPLFCRPIALVRITEKALEKTHGDDVLAERYQIA